MKIFDFVPQILILSYGGNHNYEMGLAILLNGESRHEDNLPGNNYDLIMHISWNGKTVTYYGEATGDLGSGQAARYGNYAQYNVSGVVYRYAAIG